MTKKKEGKNRIQITNLMTLMTAVAAFGILFAVTFPAYNTYTAYKKNRVTLSRSFSGPDQYPSDSFQAYGILVFPERATTSSRLRHLMICNAYVAALPHFTELNQIPISEQMVTVWPIENNDLATKIDRDTTRSRVCEMAVDHYGLIEAKSALIDAKNAAAIGNNLIRGDSVNFNNLNKGPYLLGWAPGSTRGNSDALVLVIDLTRVNLPDHAKAIFSRWRNEVEKNPMLWSNGWDVEAIRLKVRLWTDDVGVIVSGMFINDK